VCVCVCVCLCVCVFVCVCVCVCVCVLCVCVCVTHKRAISAQYFTESRVCLDAIEELFPASEGFPALLPAGVEKRARARIFGEVC
jgi:hypothetical protein